MSDWLENFPSELAYGLATSLVLAAGAWLVARMRRRATPPDAPRDRPTALPASVGAVPRLLPRAPQRFVNRDRELAALDALLMRAHVAAGPTVALVSGMHGVGKSAVGSMWAHRNYDRFSGGTLSADFSRHRNPHGVEVSEVLGDFLRELGTSDVAIPPTLRDRQRLFERLTSDRSLLVVLDDVDQPAQALSMLPSGAGSLVVITSSYKLEELVRAGAEPVLLDPLDAAAAKSLLMEIAGPARFEAEDPALSGVLAACGGLPIALCVCGARLAMNPGRPIGWLADELASGTMRLTALSPEGSFDVRAVFDIAYADLPRVAASIYRRLGLHPGPDFTVSAAAALVGMSPQAVEPVLGQLEDTYLLQRVDDAHLRPHDLVRDHMRGRVEADESEGSREKAVRRVVDWYTAAVRAADHAVVDDRLRLGSDDDVSADNLPRLRSSSEAFGWFARERRNVMAAQRAALDRERWERVWQIAEALWPLCASHKRFSEWIESHQAAIIAGRKLNDDAVLARMHSQLARAYAELGETNRSEEEMERAMRAARAAGQPALLASVIEFGGVCQLRADRLEEALISFRTARGAFEACGLRRGVALQDYHAGWSLILLGRDDIALAPLASAQHAMEALGDDINVGRTLARRGTALWHLGRAEDARAALDAAIDVLRRAGVGFEQAEANEVLAEIADAENDVPRARKHRQRALQLYRELGHPRADVLLAMLDSGTAA